MKKSILITLLMIFTSCKVKKDIQINFDCTDVNACLEYEEKLKMIHDYNFLLKKVDLNELTKIGDFFGKITSIETTADVQIDGLLPPTIKDYENWSAWYSQNYNCLSIKNKKVIVLQNCVLDN